MMGRVLGSVKSQKGISVFPAVVFLALLLFLCIGPFSRTVSDLIEPVLLHVQRTSSSVLTWIS